MELFDPLSLSGCEASVTSHRLGMDVVVASRVAYVCGVRAVGACVSGRHPRTSMYHFTIHTGIHHENDGVDRFVFFSNVFAHMWL